jgi:glycolate oxidase FAD binding subunit
MDAPPKKTLDGRYVVLSTDRLAGLEIYEPADVTLTARAGTTLGDLGTALRAHRQWLPFDPPAVARRTVGGLVASGESGPVATGYGELRNHVLGATRVCGDGRVLRLGGRVVKNVAGFDLLRPVVGSRGRLGVITSVCLRAFPIPAVDQLLLFRANDTDGLRDVARGVRTAPVLPVSCVVWNPDGGSMLAVRLQGARPTVEADQATLERHTGVAFEHAVDQEAVLEGIREFATGSAIELRMSLLPSRLFEGIAAARAALGPVRFAADAYGGSARLGVDATDAEALRRVREAVEALGGSLSVMATSPDVGVSAMGSRLSPDELDFSSRLEQVFDPSGVFWPCRV